MPAELQGYAVLLGACFRSVPQILRIVRAKSASGVSLSANIAELLAYSITVAYNLRLGAHRAAIDRTNHLCWRQSMCMNPAPSLPASAKLQQIILCICTI